MSQDKNTSFSLLTQQEIDILVKFLTKTKSAVDSDVMSQNSIDKLIHLIRTDKDRLALSSFLSFDSLEDAILKNLPFRDSAQELCELRYHINEETNCVELTIYNSNKDATYSLTTDLFDEKDTAGWGCAIPPSYFIQIAHLLSLKCTQATYDSVYTTFATFSYGSAEAKISEIYLPDSKTLVGTLI